MRVRVRATLWRARWLVAAVCLSLAVVIVVSHLRPPEPATFPVIVAARDLSAGTVLGPADLTVRHDHTPAAHRPEMADLVGARLTVGVPEGLPLATTMLAGDGFAEGAPPGTVVVPVRLADGAILQIAQQGDYLDLYLAPADTGGQRTEAQLITRAALILSIPQPAEDESFLIAPGTSSRDTTVVVLAVNADDATVLTGGSGFAPFRAVLVTEPPT